MSAIEQQEWEALRQEADAAEQAEQMEDQPESAAPEIPTVDMLRPAVDVVCSVALANWDVSQGEREAVAEAYAAVLDKYCPGGVGDWGPEVTALVITASIAAPRLAAGKPPRVPAPEAESSQAPPAGSGGGIDWMRDADNDEGA